MASQYKTYSLSVQTVENLKKTMEENTIRYRSAADAIHKAIDKYITDFKLKTTEGIF